MACRLYEKDLIDLALGVIEPAREGKLRAHLDTCPSCGERLAVQRQLISAVDRGVSASVAADPSPDFVARIRRRVAAESASAGSWWTLLIPDGLRRWGAIPAAACAVLILTLAIWSVRRQPATLHTLAPSEIARTHSTTQSMPDASQTATQAPNHVAALSSPFRPHATKRTGLHQTILSARPEPEVIVPSGQREAVLQLVAALRAGRVDGASLAATPSSMDFPELKIDPIEVLPLDSDGKPSEASPENTATSEPKDSPRSP